MKTSIFYRIQYHALLSVEDFGANCGYIVANPDGDMNETHYP